MASFLVFTYSVFMLINNNKKECQHSYNINPLLHLLTFLSENALGIFPYGPHHALPVCVLTKSCILSPKSPLPPIALYKCPIN